MSKQKYRFKVNVDKLTVADLKTLAKGEAMTLDEFMDVLNRCIEDGIGHQPLDAIPQALAQVQDAIKRKTRRR